MALSVPKTNISINELNNDCFLEIFSYLEIADIKQVEKVCKRWKGLCSDAWKAVEGLECIGSIWYLLGNTNQRLYELTCINDLKECLKSCGQHVTYFRLSCRSANESAIFTSLFTTAPQFCKNLQNLVIDSIHSPSAAQIISMGNHCMNLEKLIFTRIDQDLEKELSELLSKNKRLKYFKLGGTLNKMTGAFLEQLSSDTIEEIHIGGCYDLKRRFFKSTMGEFKQLKVLNISYSSRITDAEIAKLTTLKKLETLIMSNLWKVTDDFIGQLPNTLKILICGGCSNIRDRGVIEFIERATNLRQLDLSQCPITNLTVAAAIESTKNRTNGIVLEMNINYTHTNPRTAIGRSPFLKLYNEHYHLRS